MFAGCRKLSASPSPGQTQKRWLLPSSQRNHRKAGLSTREPSHLRLTKSGPDDDRPAVRWALGRGHAADRRSGRASGSAVHYYTFWAYLGCTPAGQAATLRSARQTVTPSSVQAVAARRGVDRPASWARSGSSRTPRASVSHGSTTAVRTPARRSTTGAVAVVDIPVDDGHALQAPRADQMRCVQRPKGEDPPASPRPGRSPCPRARCTRGCGPWPARRRLRGAARERRAGPAARRRRRDCAAGAWWWGSRGWARARTAPRVRRCPTGPARHARRSARATPSPLPWPRILRPLR